MNRGSHRSVIADTIARMAIVYMDHVVIQLGVFALAVVSCIFYVLQTYEEVHVLVFGRAYRGVNYVSD